MLFHFSLEQWLTSLPESFCISIKTKNDLLKESQICMFLNSNMTVEKTQNETNEGVLNMWVSWAGI